MRNLTSREWRAVHEKIDALIKVGQGGLATAELRSINLAQVPREWRAALANLFRRTNQISKAFKLLGKQVREEQDADPAMLAEYAVLLQRIGSFEEALAILRGLDPSHAPDSLLNQALCHFSRWEYRQAVPLLQSFVERAPSPYAKLVGEINLGAALTFLGKNGEAEALLRNVAAMTKERGHWRLHGNALQTLAELHFNLNDEKACRDFLEQASGHLAGQRNYDDLFVAKWKAALACLRSNDPSPLAEFKNKAEERRHWESAREADFLMLTVRFDENRWRHLFAGTPYPEYRERLKTRWGHLPDPENYVWGGAEAPCFRVATGQLDGAHLNTGKMIHRLLACMLTDLYRPRRLGQIFAALYPGEYFDYESSPSRVHQLLTRGRSWIQASGLDMGLECFNGDFRLSKGRALAIEIPAGALPKVAAEFQIRRIAEVFGVDKPFSAAEARRALNLKVFKCNQILNDGLKTGLINKIGRGANTLYRVKAA